MKKNNKVIWDKEKVIKKGSFPIGRQKDIFYFGLLLPAEVDNKIKKEKEWVVEGKKQTEIPVIVTDKHEIYEVNDLSIEELHLSFHKIPTFLPERWSLSDIQKYLEEEEAVDNLQLLKEVIGTYKEYIYIPNETWYKVHAIWDIATYVYPLFEAFPFLELRGIAGTGKTKSLVVSCYIAFNGQDIMVNPSEATLFRLKDEIRGTTYFDEAEKLWVYNRYKQQYEGDNRTELINASYSSDSKVPRQEKIGDRFQTVWYDPYAPTQFGSITGLYGTTETRAITRITTKSSDKDQRGEKDPREDKEDPKWQNIRASCYRFALKNWKIIQKESRSFENTTNLRKRDLQIWKPLFVLAKIIDEEAYKEIIVLAESLSKQRKDDLLPETSKDYLVLVSLKECIKIFKERKKIYVEEIKKKYCNNTNDEAGYDDKYLNRTLSNKLDKLGFKDCRDRDSQGSYFEVSIEQFNQIVHPLSSELVILQSEEEII